MGINYDPRSLHDRLLGQMATAGGMNDPIAARRAGLGILRSNLTAAAAFDSDLTLLPCAEAELVFAFDGVTPGRYRELWMQEPLPLATLADLIAVHLAQGHEPVREATARARWLQAQIIEAVVEGQEMWPRIGRANGLVDPATALAWLRRHRPHLVPDALLPSSQRRQHRTVADSKIAAWLAAHPALTACDEAWTVAVKVGLHCTQDAFRHAWRERRASKRSGRVRKPRV